MTEVTYEHDPRLTSSNPVATHDDRLLKVHEHGFVQLVGATYDFVDLQPYSDHNDSLVTLPDTLDAMVARAARVSYAGGTQKQRSDEGLIDYLMRKRHTSPFEQVELKFVIKAPLYVTQQFLRHRTANVNQESARYSVIENEAYYPAVFRGQDARNKQGSGGMLPPADQEQADRAYTMGIETGFAAYDRQLEVGVSRELARGVLPHGTYTTFVWKVDLHNLLHFLKLRLDAHAQPETQDYAAAIYALAVELAPVTFDAWDRHVRSAITFSSDELGILAAIMRHGVSGYANARDETLQVSLEGGPLSQSRREELRAKLERVLAVPT